jgi:hypothetical protein
MITAVPPKKTKPVSLKRYRYSIVCIGFVLLLLLPSFDQIWGFSKEFRSTEKRILAPFPTFRFPHVKTYIHEFDQYYKENFGWRNALFYVYSNWKLNVLGKSPLPEKVVVGKNGWFYPGNSLNRVVDQYQGNSPLSLSSLRLIASRLANFQKQLAKQNARLYLVVAPDSYSIYPENLPSYLHKNKESNLDLLKKYITENTHVPLIDIRSQLLSAKKKHVVYYQTDTHWNEYGALTASLAIVDRIRQDYPQISEGRFTDYHIESMKGTGGDLSAMLALDEEYVDSIVYKIRPLPAIAAWQVQSVPEQYGKLPSSRFIGKQSKLPKLLLIGDSFSFNMNSFIPNYFGSTYIVRSDEFNPELARTEQPDIVIVEIVERNIDLLVSY